MAGDSFLTRPATRADVIGAVLATPMIVWAIVSLPAVYALPAKFAKIHTSFDEPLPAAARWFLQLGGAGLVTAFGLLVMAPLAVLLFSRRPWAKVLTPIACGLGVLLLQAALVKALLEPFQRIMQRLAG